ncbi:MAG: hypothetical protein OHK0038_27520 [Flammeovirgaceae bacterium]
MKKILFSIAFILVIFAKENAQANTNNPTDKSAQITALEEELEDFSTKDLIVTEEEALAEVAEEVNEVRVYDMEGNLIHFQSVQKDGEIDFKKIPSGASLLMTDNSVQYFVR